MRPFTFSYAIVLAFVLALVGAGAYAALSVVTTDPWAFKSTVTLLAALYGGALLYSANERVGRIVVPLVWLVLTAAVFSLLQPLAYLLVQIGVIWLVRSLYFHGGPMAALLDLGLTVCAFGVGLWAAGTGSWFMMIWSFFLVQGLAVLIPDRRPNAAANHENQNFRRAREQAHTALKKLVTH